MKPLLAMIKCGKSFYKANNFGVPWLGPGSPVAYHGHIFASGPGSSGSHSPAPSHWLCSAVRPLRWCLPDLGRWQIHIWSGDIPVRCPSFHPYGSSRSLTKSDHTLGRTPKLDQLSSFYQSSKRFPLIFPLIDLDSLIRNNKPKHIPCFDSQTTNDKFSVGNPIQSSTNR